MKVTNKQMGWDLDYNFPFYLWTETIPLKI